MSSDRGSLLVRPLWALFLIRKSNKVFLAIWKKRIFYNITHWAQVKGFCSWVWCSVSSSYNVLSPMWPLYFWKQSLRRPLLIQSVLPSLEFWMSYFDTPTGRALLALEGQQPWKEGRRWEGLIPPALAVSRQKKPPAGLPDFKSTLVLNDNCVSAEQMQGGLCPSPALFLIPFLWK